MDSADDIGFHWDKDYSVEANSGINVFPHVATVTYLTDLGAPTVVIEKSGPMQCGDSLEGSSQRCWISCPAPGKHMSFDGRFLHAAPAELAERMADSSSKGKKRQREGGSAADGNMRVTFLANSKLQSSKMHDVHCQVAYRMSLID